MHTDARDAARLAAPDANAVGVLISLVASVATALIVVTAGSTWEVLREQPTDFLAFAALTLALQLMAVEVYGRGSISVAGIGMLAMGFAFGAGPAMVVAVGAAVLHVARTRGKLHRGVFNAATWALGAGAAAAVYHVVVASNWHVGYRLPVAFFGGVVFFVVNIGLLTYAMSLAEGARPAAIWRERFRWLTAHYLAFGPLAVASTIAFEKIGAVGLLAFALPPALMIFSTRQYLERTRAAVEEVRRANEELQLANEALAARNEDLHELFEFAGGLAAQAHDRASLVAYAQGALERLTGADVSVSLGLAPAGGVPLESAGEYVGALHVGETEEFDAERWARLREAVVPQLSTALESALLVDKVRKTHLETIAALSRSMEAKDYYTGGHTERVADVAVALARRLGFTGSDLDSIQIGALLHDIGKIGIPEGILRKPGPLDEDEWRVMKEHPIISEYILSEVDLPPIVLAIARHSHERFDGDGYPDGLAGEDIPLAARIVLVADAFDALTSDRPYRRGRHTREAMIELRDHSGTQFCPTVIEALEQVYRDEPQVLVGTALHAVSVA